MDNEEFYDTEIAPILRELGEKCQDREMSFLAVCQFGEDDSDVGHTLTQQPGASPNFRLPSYAARSKGNMDILIGQLMLDGEKYGHGSVYLNILNRKDDV